MGMFDTIGNKFFCPFCGKEIEENSFQTKDTACLGDAWTIEDLIKFYPWNSTVEIHDVCKNCGKFISINLIMWRMGAKRKEEDKPKPLTTKGRIKELKKLIKEAKKEQKEDHSDIYQKWVEEAEKELKGLEKNEKQKPKRNR